MDGLWKQKAAGGMLNVVPPTVFLFFVSVYCIKLDGCMHMNPKTH